MVRVVQGEHTGQLVEVIGTEGCAFSSVIGVKVRTSNGDVVWYWPWNLSGNPAIPGNGGRSV